MIRAQTLMDAGKLPQAQKLLASYLKAHPESAPAHKMTGYLLFRQGHARESMAEYVLASRSAELNAFDLRIFALDCAAIPDLPEAAKWMQRSLDLNANDAATWEAMGHVYFRTQEYGKAIQALEHSLQLSRKNVAAASMLGLSNERLTQLDAAVAAYRNAIVWQEPKASDYVPFLGLGRVLLTQNQPEHALPNLQHAVELNANNSEAQELLAQAYTSLNMLPEAQKALERAIALSPRTARLHLILAQLYRKRGMVDRAKSELQHYSDLNQQPEATGVEH